MSGERTGQDTGRREFLKKSLVTGAVLWSAPAVTTLPGGKAWAQIYGVCNCNASAYGLFVSIPALGINSFFGEDTCVADVPVGNFNAGPWVRATTVCGADFSSVNAGCSAEATIATLTVRLGTRLAPTLLVTASVLLTTASATCSPCNTTGTFSAAAVSLSGSLVGSPINVNLSGACNLDVGGLGLVIVNEQTCNGGTLGVNALHVQAAGIEVIAAHSEAGATGCACATC